jgi:two-component system, OmpR family, response regulator
MKTPRILVVDDQADIRELLKTVLSVKGYQVTTACGAATALEHLSLGVTPDLILLDVQMPDIDGWDTLAAIRGRYGRTGPRVALCTVKGHPRDLIHGWSLGCDGYIWKPFDVNLLLYEVATVLGCAPDDRARVRRTAICEAEMLLRAIS